jgi:hypothetical protein
LATKEYDEGGRNPFAAWKMPVLKKRSARAVRAVSAFVKRFFWYFSHKYKFFS